MLLTFFSQNRVEIFIDCLKAKRMANVIVFQQVISWILS